MKIVNVIGGLGNQLFQYAFYLSLKDRFDEIIKLDILRFENYGLHNGYELEKVFKINEVYCTQQEKNSLSYDDASIFRKVMRKFELSNKNELIEQKSEEYVYSVRLLGEKHKEIYYRGYWQSYKYFEHLASELKNKLMFIPIVDPQNLNLLKKINVKNSVSIHVRRGDYNNHPEFGGICELSYYKNAIKVIDKEIENPFYVVFSNDINWCKENLKLPSAVYVDWNGGEKSFRDLQLMSLCQNNIIANSSFSWWGAWLNCNAGKIVIAPEQWMRKNKCDELLPVSWLRLPSE